MEYFVHNVCSLSYLKYHLNITAIYRVEENTLPYLFLWVAFILVKTTKTTLHPPQMQTNHRNTVPCLEFVQHKRKGFTFDPEYTFTWRCNHLFSNFKNKILGNLQNVMNTNQESSMQNKFFWCLSALCILEVYIGLNFCFKHTPNYIFFLLAKPSQITFFFCSLFWGVGERKECICLLYLGRKEVRECPGPENGRMTFWFLLSPLVESNVC